MKRVKRSNAYEATMEENIQGVHSQNTSKNVASNMNEQQDIVLSKTASVSRQIERLFRGGLESNWTLSQFDSAEY